ncbi:MAG: hypothetical protein A4E57_01942 [Syntrophorhabdaceae bacterium PtaU1.Bin034]|jgi:uncharacterized protein with ATP-grasp and redox domains|nr:MAG: hypothetical protein A4E57_01942 [Syntrophorhabdaceae bacterium PtaU1.Bin034]
MKILPYCRDCLKNLATQVVALSRGGQSLLDSSLRLVDEMFSGDRSPTDISNTLLRQVRDKTGAYDPYADRKAVEFERAMEAAKRLRSFFPDTLEGALWSSAFGNGGDFFLEHQYTVSQFGFSGNVAKIAHQVYISNKILILGDNVGDLVFDLPLVERLKGLGKKIFYAVKEHPVQNDLSMPDVAKFGLKEMCENVISTGTDEVGIRREEMSGRIRECWEDGSLVIAKGMGNYETISEYGGERPVVHIMKVKCRSVAETLGREIGDYIAIPGGDHG